MSEYSKTISFEAGKDLSDSDILFLESKISQIDGIESLTISNGTIDIEYSTFKQSEESVRDILKKHGYPVQIRKNRKHGIMARFIENLAKSNKATYGSKKLDCCDLKHQKI